MSLSLSEIPILGLSQPSPLCLSLSEHHCPQQSQQHGYQVVKQGASEGTDTLHMRGGTQTVDCIAMNSKAAHVHVQAAKVPCVPGSEGLIKDEADCLKVVKKIGLPVMIKATAGANREAKAGRTSAHYGCRPATWAQH